MSKKRPVHNSAIITDAFIRTGKNQDYDDLLHWHGSQLTEREKEYFFNFLSSLYRNN